LNTDKIAKIVQAILIGHFKVTLSDFKWEKSLTELNKDFEILGIMLDLENLLKNELNQNISLLDNIDPTFNTPKDILVLITTDKDKINL